jgi:hypothetical protein
MDPASVTLIATTAVNLLSPYLKKAGEEVGKQVGQEAWNKAKELYQAVREKFSGKKEAEQSLDSLKDRPDDPQSKVAVELKLNDELRADREFAVRVINILEAADKARAEEAFGITIHGNVEKLVNVRDIYGDPTFNL